MKTLIKTAFFASLITFCSCIVMLMLGHKPKQHYEYNDCYIIKNKLINGYDYIEHHGRTTSHHEGVDYILTLYSNKTKEYSDREVGVDTFYKYNVNGQICFGELKYDDNFQLIFLLSFIFTITFGVGYFIIKNNE